MVVRIAICALSAFLIGVLSVERNEMNRVRISGGEFTPLYGVTSSDEKLLVRSFYIDTYPVTNRDFLQFVEEQLDWRRDRILPLFADRSYLVYWTKNGERYLPPVDEFDAPVVDVSWFGANAYCRARDGRLPTVLEWEYVAAASATKKNATKDPEFVQQLLDWYSQPTNFPRPRSIGLQPPNIWGVHDLHGLIWEWTSDFNSVFVAGDSRRDNDQLKNLFCGNSVGSAADRANYAAFMRYALRNSLKAEFTMDNLGFRCAYD